MPTTLAPNVVTATAIDRVTEECIGPAALLQAASLAPQGRRTVPRGDPMPEMLGFKLPASRS
jgi:hypothetical protein